MSSLDRIGERQVERRDVSREVEYSQCSGHDSLGAVGNVRERIRQSRRRTRSHHLAGCGK